tara:strand:+ start:138 stop:461 length:324 start_codon:yes stop_codon:yes gene_type:complete
MPIVRFIKLAKPSPTTEKQHAINIKRNRDIRLIGNALIDGSISNMGEITIAKRKPSKVLFGLTLAIKGLLPNFLPAKNAIESIKTLIRIINKIKNRSLFAPEKKDTE